MAVERTWFCALTSSGTHQATQLDELGLLRKSQLACRLHHEHPVGQHVNHFSPEGRGEAGVGGALALCCKTGRGVLSDKILQIVGDFESAEERGRRWSWHSMRGHS